MPGECRLHGDVGGLGVADLTDHDDIRILAQERAEAGRERDSRLWVDLRLVHIPHVILDRVLHGRHIHLGTVQHVHQRVKRGRFSGTGRTARDEHAERFLEVIGNDL